MGKGKHETEESLKSATPEDEVSNAATNVPRPPDGGWGWVVVFSSFIVHIIADGIVYSFGVFFIEFLDYFKGGKGETSWVGSLVPAVTYSVGPLASALTNRYGCRIVTILGAFISSLGFIISIFAPNIYYLYFTFGIMAGLGFGLIYLPAIVSVANYFEKKRSFATGLAVCGSGFGTFIFAPFSKFLVDQFTWKGAVLIQGGLILNVVVCGALFRPLEAPEEKEEIIMKKLKKEASDLEQQTKTKKGSIDHEELKVLLTETPSAIFKNRNLEITETHALANSHNHLSLPRPTNGALGIANLARSDGAIHRVPNGKSSIPLSAISFQRQHSHGSTAGPLMRKDIFYQASLQNIPMYKSNPDFYITSVTSIPDAGKEDTAAWRFCNCCKPSMEFRETIHQMLDFSLLNDVIFVMFAVSNFFTSIGFNMPFIYIPDRALEAGIDESRAAFLLSVIGIANTVGRVLFGWLSDRSGVNRLMLYNTALTICGIATALSPYCGGNYALLVTYCAVFGLFIGVYVSLTSVVLVDLLGLDKLTNSFGLLLLFQGAATFIGPPMAGWMYDWTGSYDVSFQVNGAMVAFSGAMLYFIPMVIRYKEKKLGISTVTEVDLGDTLCSPEPELDVRVRTLSV
ncbi:monocarboxylate transporter 12 [Patella vulgata]|uniref:monocarboxylate transporter 12 n=1 Tax=Patella vulgata TaxID=6465 RepID=UPI00217F76FB|nr:monocarboxylate transporter 12 [Patella vulgata]XP_050398489.1 monocarboxylate transporter 12 [Patella vulgata]XP_050398490.1 monocarboxylate transporter 12 [Patella vulgata]